MSLPRPFSETLFFIHIFMAFVIRAGDLQVVLRQPGLSRQGLQQQVRLAIDMPGADKMAAKFFNLNSI